MKAIDGHLPNIEYLLLSNRVSIFIEILKDQLAILVPEPRSGFDVDFNPGKFFITYFISIILWTYRPPNP